jgi:hypothetical protein
MEEGYRPELMDFILPFVVLLVVLMVMHIVIVIFLPLRWQAVRAQFEKLLEKRLRHELETVYAPVPGDVLEKLQQERRQIESILGEVQEVTRWLEEREQSARIVGLYGSSH